VTPRSAPASILSACCALVAAAGWANFTLMSRHVGGRSKVSSWWRMAVSGLLLFPSPA
jgi:drug/metabolite transporter (DMT)-like permease